VRRDTNDHIICKMYDEINIHDETKVNFYILKNFLRQEIPAVNDELKQYVRLQNLIDLFKFDRVKFDKTIMLSSTDLGDKDLVTSKWEMVKLGDYISFEYGQGLPKNKRIKGDYPVVGSNGIVGVHNTFIVKAPVIVVGRKGSAGKVTLIEKPCFPIDTTFYLKFDDNNFDYKYLYYILKQLQLEKLSGGIGPGGLNRHDAYALKIPKPEKIIQEKIAKEIDSLEKYTIENALSIIKKYI
jgi:type I restriction enzyme M protein